jgi:hypothetical protein
MDTALKNELEKVFFSGSEDDVRQFVKEKWQYLPQDLQDKLAIALLVEGISGHADDIADFASFRNACVEVLKHLSAEEATPANV